MTQAEAVKLAAKLFAAFPFTQPKLTAMVYTENLQPLPRFDWAVEAVNDLIRQEHRLPAVAAVLEHYQAVARRNRPRELAEPQMTSDEMEENKRQAKALLERLSRKVTL